MTDLKSYIESYLEKWFTIEYEGRVKEPMKFCEENFGMHGGIWQVYRATRKGHPLCNHFIFQKEQDALHFIMKFGGKVL